MMTREQNSFSASGSSKTKLICSRSLASADKDPSRLYRSVCVCVSRSKFGDGRGNVLQGGSSLGGGESLDGLQSLVAMVTAQVHRRAHAFLRFNRCQKLQTDENTH